MQACNYVETFNHVKKPLPVKEPLPWPAPAAAATLHTPPAITMRSTYNRCTNPTADIEKVLAATCAATGLTPDEIKSKSRKRHITKALFIYGGLAYNLCTNNSTESISGFVNHERTAVHFWLEQYIKFQSPPAADEDFIYRVSLAKQYLQQQ